VQKVRNGMAKIEFIVPEALKAWKLLERVRLAAAAWSSLRSPLP
jgi:hypothetical protein